MDAIADCFVKSAGWRDWWEGACVSSLVGLRFGLAPKRDTRRIKRVQTFRRSSQREERTSRIQ